MQFDARTAKLLTPGKHLNMDDCPGLRLKATASGRTWVYRYKSPIDSLMRQIKIGAWPAMSAPAAIVKWESLRQVRDSGRDPALEKRLDRNTTKNSIKQKRQTEKSEAFTVKILCEAYLKGHIERNRKEKSVKETRRIFETMLGDFVHLQASSVTRAQAFELLESHSNTPVLASNLRAELGAAWEYALDAGRLPENTPNWWRQIMRGRLKSKGKKIDGKKIGTAKRALSESELRLLIPWLPNFTQNVRDILTIYLWTGMRGAEIVSIEAREITEESDGLWLTIPKLKTKNAKHENATDLRVPLVGRAQKIIEKRLGNARNGYLFWSHFKQVPHIAQKAVQEAVFTHQPYCKYRARENWPILPVSHWSPHDLRRTSRTLLAAIGCPSSIGEVIIGHMLPGVKGIYDLHTYDKERRFWLTKLSEHLESLA